MLLAGALAGLAGCYRRVSVPLSANGATVACYGEDHLFVEGDFSETGRRYCVAECHRAGYAPGAPTTDQGGITPRLNPGVPSGCL